MLTICKERAGFREILRRGWRSIESAVGQRPTTVGLSALAVCGNLGTVWRKRAYSHS